jgi:PAS domain S-box-containing protein
LAHDLDPPAPGASDSADVPDAPGRADPVLAELRALRAANARLQERLDLVQAFTNTGVFERDAATMQGEWDAHMYRIWGLPEQPPGTASPHYDSLTQWMQPDEGEEGAMRKSLAHAGEHGQRLRIRRPDGQLRHLHARWLVLNDAQGRAQRVVGINTDDTEVYELANRAERLRSQLDVALELGHISVWRHDLATGRLVLDQRGCEVIGVPYSEQGVSLAEARARIHPDDRALPAFSAELTMRTGAPSDMELRYPREGGGWKHVMLRRAPHRNPDGTLLGFIGVLMDVTDRVEDNRRALDLARQLEAAAESARIGLWSTELGSRLPNWNRRMYALFGLDPQQGPLELDDWLVRCVHPDDLARVRKTLVGWWLEGEGGIEVEFRILRPSDGVLRWLVVRGEIRRSDGAGQPRKAEGVAIDITEQQQTLSRLRETVERMTLTNRALGLGTWEHTRESDEFLWDAQMFRLRGVESAARTIDRAEMASYVHPDDRSAVMADQAGRMLDGEAWQTEFRVQHADGQVRWITSQSVPVLDEQGRETRRIGVAWDSTEVHVNAEAVRQRERVLAESQAKSQTLSRISHELRTPLNAVLGFVQLLRGSDDRLEEGKRQRWLAHIDEAGRHLLALIDDVLELSRAEGSERGLTQQAVALAPLVDATLPLVAGQAQARQVELQCGALEGAVLADPVRLRQVLINLLSNAIKYNRPGGQVRLWSEQQGEQLALHVADTGLGIAPERLRHAFEPFNRLGAEATAIEGSGIGLTIVKVLVEHMGGSIEVQSQPGQGSEFIVRLAAAGSQGVPTAAPAPAVATPAAPQPASSEPPARLLYIEDNPVNALLVRELLADRPSVELRVAETGHAGLQQARDWQPALILVDMLLPDIDGHAVLRALRDDPATADIRCVALSANATPADLQAARAAGFTDYWTKPIHFDRILQDLRALLGRPL